MGTEYQLAPAIGDEHEEAAFAVVDHGAVESGVVDPRDHTLRIALTGQFFGEPHAGVVRIGESAPR